MPSNKIYGVLPLMNETAPALFMVWKIRQQLASSQHGTWAIASVTPVDLSWPPVDLGWPTWLVAAAVRSADPVRRVSAARPPAPRRTERAQRAAVWSSPQTEQTATHGRQPVSYDIYVLIHKHVVLHDIQWMQSRKSNLSIYYWGGNP